MGSVEDGIVPVNRLGAEKSPYLLQHASNPVDWYPWGEEAFAAARRLKRPVFLSVGYSTCHWCHVMATESFEDPDIAEALNRDFISVKVDREERPDVDSLYMHYVTAATGQGGWPMSVFLTPDLVPVYGGTYFPPRVFAQVLREVSATWGGERVRTERAATAARRILEASPPASGAASPALHALVRSGLSEISAGYDAVHGGFGPAPKFPRPSVLEFLFHRFHRTGDANARDMALQSLRAMAAGGIHDQLAGGFHRYATDPGWLVPHFEKMLYDQAQLAGVYTEAFRLTGDGAFAAVARDVLDYVRSDLTSAEGGFWSAEDADSPDPANRGELREGASYLWTRGQFGRVLGGDDAEFAAAAWGVTWEGISPMLDATGKLKGMNVLRAAMTPAQLAARFGGTPGDAAERLAALRSTALLARLERPRPDLDDKVLTAWNGLMISAFARGAASLGNPDYLATAGRAATFVLEHLRRPGDRPLLRRWRDGEAAIPGFLEDYAFLIQGLLDLYEADGEFRWLEAALDLEEAQDRLFWDRDGAGYFSTDGLDPLLLARRKETADSGEPSGNSIAALNLLRLARMTGRPDLAERADLLLRWSAATMPGAAFARPLMLAAFILAESPRKDIVLAGNAGTPDLGVLRRLVLAHLRPGQVVLTADGGRDQRALARIVPYVKDMSPPDGHAVAYVCTNGTCALPVSSPAEVTALLAA